MKPVAWEYVSKAPEKENVWEVISPFAPFVAYIVALLLSSLFC